MAVILRFDPAGNLEPLTLVLCRHNGERIGAINNYENFNFADSMTDPSEFSFSINKAISPLWDEIKDMRLIWIPEWDKYYEIGAEIDDGDQTTKNVSANHLPEYELSHLLIFTTEINTDADINSKNSDDPTTFFNPDVPELSLLHRITTDKAVNFTFGHIDESLCNIKKVLEFTFDGCSLHEAFMEIAQEVGCLFVFESSTGEDGTIVRTINAYDLEANCLDCGYRGEFEDTCPECESKNIKPGYGEDTTIFFSKDNYVNSVTYTTDKDSVKNCFRLEAGDDYMTDTIQGCNPNGTKYIWYISDDIKSEMSSELIDELDAYDEKYQRFCATEKFEIGDVSSYNNIIAKYSNPETVNYTDLIQIPTEVEGFTALTNVLYDAIDLGNFLSTSLMPSPTMGSEPKASEQIAILKTSLTKVGVYGSITEYAATKAVEGMAEALIDVRFTVEVKCTAFSNSTWRGTYTVTNNTNEEDTATSDPVSVTVTNEHETFLRDKIQKVLAKGSTENFSIAGIFGKELEEFKKEIQKYGLSTLNIFYECCDGVMAILAEQKAETETYTLSEDFYGTYSAKLKALKSEIALRESEIETAEAMQEQIQEIRESIQAELDLETELGPILWKEFSSFRREEVYSNSNYISDGLSNSEIMQNAQEFLKAANKELIKSATLQHSVSTSLKNVFLMEKIRPLLQHFSIGNWMRIEVDGFVYKLRLLSYEIDFNDYENSNITFSDVTKVADSVSDLNDIINNMSGIIRSYESTTKQASNGDQANTVVNQWFNDSLDMTLVKLVNNAGTQDIVYGENGILCRRFNEFTGGYDDEQMRIVNSTIAFTTDGWKSISTALGKYYYKDPEGKTVCTYGIIGETIVGQLIIGKSLKMYNGNNKLLFDANGLNISNSTNNVVINPDSSSIFVIKKTDGTKIMEVNSSGDLSIVGNITSTSGKIGPWVICDDSIYKTNKNFGNSSGMYFGNSGLSLTDKFKVTSAGVLTATSATIEGKITATSGELGNWVIHENRIQSSSNIYMGSKEAGLMLINEAGKPFICAQNSSGISTFTVDRNGLLTATDANIKGIINATGGEISGDISVSGIIETREYDAENDRTICTTINEGKIRIWKKPGNDTSTSPITDVADTIGNEWRLLLGIGSLGADYNPRIILYYNGANLGNYIDGRNLQITNITVNKITAIYDDTGIFFNSKITLQNGKGIGSNDLEGERRQLLYLSTSNVCVLSENTLSTVIRGNSVKLYYSGSSGVDVTSDERLKHDIKPLSQKYIDAFMDLNVVNYRYNNNPDKEQVGLTYQNAKKVFESHGIENFSSIVDPVEGSTEDYDMYGYLGYDGIQNIQMKIVQNHEHTIQRLEQKIFELENKLKTYEGALA